MTTNDDMALADPATTMPDAEARARRRQDVLLAVLLGIAAGLATMLLFPYLLDTMPALRAKSPLPMPALAAIQALQATVVCGLLAWLGLRMQPRAGLDAPWLRALVAGRPRPRLALASSVGLGVAAALAVLALAFVLDPHLPPRLHAAAAATATSPAASAWHGFLASFYGGIAEELELRLFLMTLLAWLVARITSRAPSAGVYWIAIVVAALLFGAGHLPAARQVWPLDAVVLVRTIGLNAVAGLAFGWLYWKRGLEAAIVAHFAADLVLHVGAPLVAGTLA